MRRRTIVVNKSKKTRAITLRSLLAVLLLLGGIVLTVRSEQKAAPAVQTQAVSEQTTEELTSSVPEPTTEENTAVSYDAADEVAYAGLTYDDLLQKLQDVAADKKLSDVELDCAKVILDGLYANYDSWSRIGGDYPSKATFICQNFIEPLSACALRFVSTDSEEGKRLDAEGSASGFTTRAGGVSTVTILYDPNDDEDAFHDTAEQLLHELTRVVQEDLPFNGNAFEKYPFLEQIIIEGGATSKQKLMNHPKTDKTVSFLYYIDDTTIDYWMDNGYGYPKEMNYYFQLQYLAGYDVMEGVARGDSVGNIERSIAKRYGTDTAAAVMELLKMIYEADEEDEALEADTDDGFQLDCALRLERTILKCIGHDMDKLKTKEEVELFTNRYRSYMIHLLPRVYRDTFTEITDQPGYLPEAAALDHKMADKIVQTGAFGIKSVTAADTLVFTTIDELKREEWIYVSYYVPPDLFNAAFWEDDDGALWLYYEDYDPFKGFREVYVYLKKSRKDAKAQIDYGYAVEGLRPFFPDAPEALVPAPEKN